MGAGPAGPRSWPNRATVALMLLYAQVASMSPEEVAEVQEWQPVWRPFGAPRKAVTFVVPQLRDAIDALRGGLC